MGNCKVHFVTFPGEDKSCPVCRLVEARQEQIDRALKAEAEVARLREALGLVPPFMKQVIQAAPNLFVEESPLNDDLDRLTDTVLAALTDTGYREGVPPKVG